MGTLAYKDPSYKKTLSYEEPRRFELKVLGPEA